MPAKSRKDRDPKKAPLVTWNQDYAAYHLGDDGRIIDLGGTRSLICRPDVESLSDVIVLSERSGGTRTLVDWWCDELKRLERPWVLVYAEDWKKDFFRWSFKDKAPPTMEQAIESFGNESGARARALALSSVWKAEDKEEARKIIDFTLIIRHITALEESVEVALALRKLRDPDSLCPGLQVIVTGTREDIFMENPEFSGYRSVADEFRPPFFNAKDVRNLLKEYIDGDPTWSFEGDAEKRFMEHTGGHPLLVRHLIERLRDLFQQTKKEKMTSRDVERAAKHMRESPPAVVSFWQKDLERFLKGNRNLIESMKGYIMGTRTIGRQKFPPPGEERALFFGGWLSLNQNDRWAITSRFHAHLARPIIDKLSR